MAFYTVKYRQHPLDPEIDLDVDENAAAPYNTASSSSSTITSSFESLTDDDGSSGSMSDLPSLIDFYYKRVNTTVTKVKVGTSLKAFTLYEFRVVAVNALGVSDETEPILVRTAATSKFT